MGWRSQLDEWRKGIEPSFAFMFQLLVVDVMWPAASRPFCHHDGQYLKLQENANPFSLKLLLSYCFVIATGKRPNVSITCPAKFYMLTLRSRVRQMIL